MGLPAKLYFLKVCVFQDPSANMSAVKSVACFSIVKENLGPFETLYEISLLFPDEDAES